MSLQATLAWDANTETDLTGYNLYVGPASNVYTTTGSPKAFGLVTTGTFDLPIAGTYFFALKAVNSFGESGFSNEVSGTFGVFQTAAMAMQGQYRIRYR